MLCPRCGKNNQVPEATAHRCFNCGFVLIGEVARPTDDIRHLARRQVLWRFLAVVVIIAAVGYAWMQQWFGLFGVQQSFEASAQPDFTPVVAATSIRVPGGTTEATLLPDGTWYVDAVVMASRRYEDVISPVAPVDIVLGWGTIPMYDLHLFPVEFGTRTATVSSSQPEFEAATLSTLVGLVRPLANDAEITRQLLRLKTGSRVGIRGWLVSGVFEGEALKSATASGQSMATYVVYVASLSVDGKVFTTTP